MKRVRSVPGVRYLAGDHRDNMGKRYEEVGAVQYRQLQVLYAHIEETKELHIELLRAIWPETAWGIQWPSEFCLAIQMEHLN